MKKVVIVLNGPPNSGKDFLADGICKYYSLTHIYVAHRRFKTALWKATADDFYVNIKDFISLATDRRTKDLPNDMLGGLSPRQAMIKTSEEYIKPLFGNDFFGKALLDEIGYEHVCVISDGGFGEEIQPLIDSNIIDKIVIVNLNAKDCSFAGDSRRFITKEDFADTDSKVVLLSFYNNKHGETDVQNLISHISVKTGALSNEYLFGEDSIP